MLLYFNARGGLFVPRNKKTAHSNFLLLYKNN